MSCRTVSSSTSSPDEGITLDIHAKRPGPNINLANVPLNFCLSPDFGEHTRRHRLRDAALRLHGRETPPSSTATTAWTPPGAS